MNETFYIGTKGDDLSDYSFAYNWDSTAPKTKTIYYYDDGLKNAQAVVDEIAAGAAEAYNYAMT